MVKVGAWTCIKNIRGDGTCQVPETRLILARASQAPEGIIEYRGTITDLLAPYGLSLSCRSKISPLDELESIKLSAGHLVALQSCRLVSIQLGSRISELCVNEMQTQALSNLWRLEDEWVRLPPHPFFGYMPRPLRRFCGNKSKRKPKESIIDETPCRIKEV